MVCLCTFYGVTVDQCSQNFIYIYIFVRVCVCVCVYVYVCVCVCVYTQGPPKKCIHTLTKENSTLYNLLL